MLSIGKFWPPISKLPATSLKVMRCPDMIPTWPCICAVVRSLWRDQAIYYKSLIDLVEEHVLHNLSKLVFSHIMANLYIRMKAVII